MTHLRINHLAVLVCLIWLHILGFLWYGPLFGDVWMPMVGLNPESMEGEFDPAPWITNLIASLAGLYLLAWLFTQLDVKSGAHGAVIGFLVTFCFHHLALMSGNMFAGEPYGLAWITGGYSVVAFTISGFILGAWKKEATDRAVRRPTYPTRT